MNGFARGLVAWLAVAAIPARAGESHLEADLPKQSNACASWVSPACRDGLANRLRGYIRLRPRHELADEEGLERSNRFTLRSVAGLAGGPYGTYEGLTWLVEAESVVALRDGLSFDAVSRPNGRTPVRDPEGVELNQVYLDYSPVNGPMGVRMGRQRLIFDDQRFVGNASGRQNEMTMDAVRLDAKIESLGLEVRYAYVDAVRRPFGDRGGRGDRVGSGDRGGSGGRGRASTKDFDSSSHLLQLSYTELPFARVTAFAYLIDLDNAVEQSSETIGARIVGELPLPARRRVRFALTCARQADAGGNPIDYRSLYQRGELTLETRELGAFTLGGERLGAGSGGIGVSTPLGSRKRFNGLADAFLDNGGEQGLRDWFLDWVSAPAAGPSAGATLHWFESDRRSRSIGWEMDARFSWPIADRIRAQLLGAYFSSRDRARASLFRVSMEATVEF